MRPLHPAVLLLAAALFLTFSANNTFFGEVAKIYPGAEGNRLFLLSIAIVLFGSLAFCMALISLLVPLRITLSLFLIIAALAGYYTDHFGAIIDTVMIENIVQTDPAEARDLITLPFVLRLGFLGLLSTAIVWWLPVRPAGFFRKRLQYTVTGLLSLVLVIATIFTFSDYYASFFREHKVLRMYTNPLTPIYSGIRVVSSKLLAKKSSELRKISEDARISESDEGNELIILVVGETARRERFSLNGYTRKTNPELEKEQRLISYSHITSCGTSTAVSVPCMFAVENRKDFDLDDAGNQENLLDVLQRAGVGILWRDNNSSSKGVADRVRYEDYKSPEINPVCDSECRDVGMLDGLQQFIDSQPGDVLIVLHQMGNHGPAYYKRYPPEFERFTPACQSQDLSSCTTEEISNAYDNAILYTDYFLSQVIGLLKANTPKYETAMLYVSDHGESLGEYGLYLHGAPYMIAPDEQINVPVILWLGDSADVELQDAFALKDQNNSHDAVYSSLLNAFEVETSEGGSSTPLFRVKE